VAPATFVFFSSPALINMVLNPDFLDEVEGLKEEALRYRQNLDERESQL